MAKKSKWNFCNILAVSNEPIIAISLSFILVATIPFAFLSFADNAVFWTHAAAQSIPDDNQTRENETNSTATTSTTLADSVDTFFAQGSINELVSDSLLSQESQQQQIFLLGGEWTLSVKEGTVRDFTARIIMVAEDGTQLHIHTIENLTDVTARASPIDNGANNSRQSITLGSNNTVVFSGFADITTNGVTEWSNVAVTIGIADGNVVSIIPNPGIIQHFFGLPIYGIVTSLVNASGESLKPAGGTPLNYHGRGETEYKVEGRDTSNASSADDALRREQPTLRIPYPDVPIESPLLESARTEIPIAEKMSNDGNYLVQLRWAQSQILPLPGIDYSVYFLDPDRPQATEEIVPPHETNLTGAARANASVTIQPEIVLNFELVESYDITVYSASQSILWEKNDLPVYGGRDNGLITFEERYRGPITIEISDIKPVGRDMQQEESAADSVIFTSFIVK